MNRMQVKCIQRNLLNQINVKHIQTKLFESSVSQTHSNEAFFNRMKVKCIQRRQLNKMNVRHFETNFFE